jgi:hypothetical protein
VDQPFGLARPLSLEAHRLPVVSAISSRRLLAARLISPSGWRGLTASLPELRHLPAGVQVGFTGLSSS